MDIISSILNIIENLIDNGIIRVFVHFLGKAIGVMDCDWIQIPPEFSDLFPKLLPSKAINFLMLRQTNNFIQLRNLIEKVKEIFSLGV